MPLLIDGAAAVEQKPFCLITTLPSASTSGSHTWAFGGGAHGGVGAAQYHFSGFL